MTTDAIPSNVSSNIACQLGLDSSSFSRECEDIDMSDWTAPAFPGLQNSAPIAVPRVINSEERVPSSKTHNKRDEAEINYNADRGDEDEEEGDDEEEEDDEEGEALFDEMGNLVAEDHLLHTAMSPQLMALLGLKPVEIATDWQPPSRPGLDNSAPLISFANAPSPTRTNDEVHEWVDRVVSTRTVTRSAGEVNEGDEEEEEEDSDEEEDEEEDDEDLLHTAMSPDLMRLLGLAPAEIATDWKPPDHPGLDNSAPIVARVSTQLAHRHNHSPALEADAAPGLEGNDHDDQRKDTVADDEDDMEEDQENENEDEEDDDSSEDEFSNLDRVPMSASLRRALGLPPIYFESSDWRPPSAPGLQNSAPIIDI